MTNRTRKANGEGSYTAETKKDGSTMYKFRVMVNGKVYSKRFKKVREGQKWVREITTAGDNGTLADPNKVLFKDFTEHWQDHRRAQGKKEGTIKDDECRLQAYVFPVFANRVMKTITVAEISHFLDAGITGKKGKKKGAELAPNTKRNIRQLLNEIFESARREKVVGFNPVHDVDPIQGANTNTRVALTKEELKALLDSAKAYYEKKKDYKNTNTMIYPFILLAAYTGARMGELLALEWEDLNTDEGTIRINKTFTKYGNVQDPKTKHSNRVVNVPPEVMSIVMSFNDGVSPYVFHTKTGSHISERNMGRGFQTVQDFAGMGTHFTAHELRHTFATLLLEAHAPIADVSRTLGHAKITTTLDFYTHATEDSSAKMGKAMSAIIGRL